MMLERDLTVAVVFVELVIDRIALDVRNNLRLKMLRISLIETGVVQRCGNDEY